MLDETAQLLPFAVRSNTPTIQTSVQPEKDIIMDMFPVEFFLSQGDKDICNEEFFCADEKQYPFNDIDITDLNFLNSVIEENEQTSSLNTTMNNDLKDLLSSVLSEETEDLSLLNFSNISSEIGSQEYSYNLNSLHAVQDANIQCQETCNSQATCSEVTSTTVDELCLPSESELSNIFSFDSSIIKDSNEINETVAGKKYIQMRRNNNIASQKSRKMRKKKNLDMAKKLKVLEKENKELLAIAKNLEEERDVLQKKLMSVFSKK